MNGSRFHTSKTQGTAAERLDTMTLLISGGVCPISIWSRRILPSWQSSLKAVGSHCQKRGHQTRRSRSECHRSLSARFLSIVVCSLSIGEVNNRSVGIGYGIGCIALHGVLIGEDNHNNLMDDIELLDGAGDELVSNMS